MNGLTDLRVIDAGPVPVARSQSLWHGIASAMRPTDRPVLSFCRPWGAYVCIGLHRRLTELDLVACTAMGLPVIRRQIGGGPVYCDSDQLFFQITLPARSAPASVERLYQELLEPAAQAMRTLGLDARLECVNEIVVEDRKLSGTGAGRIGEAVTVVGNVIFRFPHELMARVLALPDAARAEFLCLMRRYISSLEAEGLASVTMEGAIAALVGAFADALGVRAVYDEPTGAEVRAMEIWERRFAQAGWLHGPEPQPQAVRTVKVRAGVWLVVADDGTFEVRREVEEGISA
ncbi:MAG: lipoate--protein ligase family protein [Candidatus Dormibacteraceae bacterium]